MSFVLVSAFLTVADLFVIQATGRFFTLKRFIFSDEIETKGGTESLTFEEAKDLIKKMVRICYLRDCRATAKFHIAYTDKVLT